MPIDKNDAANDPVVLEVFSDYVCPWCYLGEGRIKDIEKRLNVEVKRVHFPLHPETPSEGRKLEDLFSTGPEEIAAKNTRMRGLMEADGLPYTDRTHTYNSRLAQSAHGQIHKSQRAISTMRFFTRILSTALTSVIRT